MARTRTLAELRAEVRQRADIENSQHVLDPEITRYINQSGAALHAKVVEAGDDHYTNRVQGTLAAVIGSAVVTLLAVPADYYKLLNLSVTVNGRRWPLERGTWDEFVLMQDAGIGGRIPPKYRQTGVSALTIFPAISAAGGEAYGLIYAKAYVDLAADGDTLDGRDGWEEWVVIDAAIKCVVKEESDPRALQAEREQVWARIKEQVATIDQANPHRVRDVEAAALDPWRWPPEYY